MADGSIRGRILTVLKRYKKGLMCIFLCVKGIVDCLFDWLLYYEFSALEEGLVYGPIDSSILKSLLAFCIIGTVVSGIDLGNKLYDMCMGKPIINFGYTEVCVVFLEDIPQLITGLFLVGCAGENSFLLLLKSYFHWFASAGVIVVVYVTVRKKVPNDQKKNCGPLLIFGLIIVFFLSTAMGYIVTHSGRDLSKHELFDGVGIYGDARDFGLTSDSTEYLTWIFFFGINEIEHDDSVLTKITLDKRHIRIQNFYKRSDNNQTDTCYSIIGTNNAVSIDVLNCSLINGTEYYYQFIYLPASYRHRLGDIQYNVRKTSTGSCDNGTLQSSRLRYFD